MKLNGKLTLLRARSRDKETNLTRKRKKRKRAKNLNPKKSLLKHQMTQMKTLNQISWRETTRCLSLLRTTGNRFLNLRFPQFKPYQLKTDSPLMAVTKPSGWRPKSSKPTLGRRVTSMQRSNIGPLAASTIATAT